MDIFSILAFFIPGLNAFTLWGLVILIVGVLWFFFIPFLKEYAVFAILIGLAVLFIPNLIINYWNSSPQAPYYTILVGVAVAYLIYLLKSGKKPTKK